MKDDKESVSVIRNRIGQLDTTVFPELLVIHASMDRAVATRVCRQGAGILLDNLDPLKAEELLKALEDHGEKCFAVPSSEVLPLPKATKIHTVLMSESDFTVVQASGLDEQHTWSRLQVLAVARLQAEIRRNTSHTKSFLTRRFHPVGTGVPGMAGIAMNIVAPRQKSGKYASVSEPAILMDLVLRDPYHRYRIEAGLFNYNFLGEQIQPSSSANLILLIRLLLQSAPHLRCNVERDKLLADGVVPFPVLSIQAFEDLVHWLSNFAQHQG